LARWDESPDANDAARIEAHVARSGERFAREQRTYDEPVEWFQMVLNPYTDAPDLIAQTVTTTPGIIAARVDRQVSPRAP
jgi:hypothetical protein